jgi:cytochrome b6-f complex iron-sulfur subunit
MAETIAELSGNEREQRVAELKRKMQEAAKKAQAAHPADEAPASASAPAAVAEAPAPVTTFETPAAEPVSAEAAAPETETAPASVAPSAPATNGATTLPAPARPAPAARTAPVVEADSAESSAKGINRREFLTYAWGAALGLLTLEAGVGSFLFLYPRFREGEFGGDFPIPLAEFKDPDSPPEPQTAGKFWMVTTAEGEAKALYMVCVHLGCLYKWEASNTRFECPCHGSKYTHDGYYIEGPATRSLDWFETTLEGDVVVVHTGKKQLGAPASESPARAV